MRENYHLNENEAYVTKDQIYLKRFEDKVIQAMTPIEYLNLDIHNKLYNLVNIKDSYINNHTYSYAAEDNMDLTTKKTKCG